jgi:NAD(P)-dependent dehydrogenase (short-subunit alcohol dehydrogenase family)
LNQRVLSNRVALVTGAGRGIGRAVALEFARQGAAVTVTARSTPELDETVSLIRQAGGAAIAVTADVTDSEAVQRVVDVTERDLGPISILVNNAGIAGPTGPLWENDTTGWWRTIETHLHGAFLLTHAVVQGMIARGAGGHVVTMASGAALKAQTNFSAYAIAKTAQVRLMETLAEEGREHGIVAFAVSPGLVYTDMIESMIADPAVARWRPDYLARIIDDRDHADHAAAAEQATRLCVSLVSGYADLLSGRHFHPSHDIEAELEKARAELSHKACAGV